MSDEQKNKEEIDIEKLQKTAATHCSFDEFWTEKKGQIEAMIKARGLTNDDKSTQGLLAFAEGIAKMTWIASMQHMGLSLQELSNIEHSVIAARHKLAGMQKSKETTSES